jgi:uncharacterized OB-fold protein
MRAIGLGGAGWLAVLRIGLGLWSFSRTCWEAAARRRLLIRRCRTDGCGAAHRYPLSAGILPAVLERGLVWERASGQARLYTWSVVHRNDLPPFDGRVPYVAAVVEPADGPRMMTGIVGCAEERLGVGMALRVGFRGEPAVPVFRPVGAGVGAEAGAVAEVDAGPSAADPSPADL